MIQKDQEQEMFIFVVKIIELLEILVIYPHPAVFLNGLVHEMLIINVGKIGMRI